MSENIINKKIYYHDTDCGGVVYYANCLKYFEEGRTELLTENGVNLKKIAQQGYLFVVAEVSLKYRKPIYYQDLIKVKTKIVALKRSFIVFAQEILRQDQLAVSGRVNVVCVDLDLKPVTLPGEAAKGLNVA